MEFDNLKDLEKFLNGKIAKGMKQVAEHVKDVEQRNIDETVYEGYKPNTPDGEPYVYKRRRDNGGLRDKKNMKEEINIVSNGVELTIENIATGSNDHFRIADLIEYGDKTNGKEYRYKRNRDGTAYQYLRGRPFTQNTIDELKRTNEHVETLKKELKRLGIDVE